MNASVATLKRSQWAVLLGVFVLFIALQTYSGFFQSYNLGGDQQMLGIVVLKQTRPELYAQDYLLMDESLLRYYTPFYHHLTGWLMSFTNDYALALLALLPAITLVYLLGMFVLIYSVTGNVWIGVLISLVSSLKWPVFGGEVWGVANLQLVMPRTLFCALSPWLTILMFRWLQSEQWWHWPLLLLLGGLSANLHPVSGMAFAELLLSMFLLTYGVSKRSFIILLASGVAAIAGAWPILAHFLESTTSDISSVSFERFSQVMLERIGTLFFRELPQFSLLGYPVGLKEREVLVWIYLVGMVIWGAAFVLFRVQRYQFLSENRLYVALFFLQLPVAYLLIRFEATVLMIIVALYGIIRILDSEFDRLDRWSLGLLALVCTYSYLGSYFLGLIWARFGLWQLTSFMAEQTRLSRFIYLPLFIFVARYLRVLLERLPNKIGILMAVSTVGLLWLIPKSGPWGLVAGLVALAWSYSRKWAELNAREELFLFLRIVTWTLVTRVLLLILQTPTQHGGVLALSLAIACGLFVIWRSSEGKRRYTAIAAGTVSLALTATFGLSAYGSSWTKDFASFPERLWAHISPSSLSQLPEDRRAAFALYSWAQMQTGVDSLFYYDSLEFRFWAQRSLTHCWKDVGAAYYTKVRLVEFYERYQRFQRAYEDPGQLLAYARQYGADYIVATRAQDTQLDLPVAFENTDYVVYELQHR